MTVTMRELVDPADWRGAELADSPEWRLRLDDTHRAELLAAATTVEAAGLPLAAVSRATVPLPTLGPVLDRLAAELTGGRGFALLQGVPVAGLTERQCDIIATGIGCHLGTVVPQGPGREPVLHVRDVGADPAVGTTRSYQHSGELGFHRDPTDIVALMCIRAAKSGGVSRIVSSVAVHNEVARTRPDLAAVLYQPWWLDRRTGDGPDSFYQRPVYRLDPRGRLSTHYVRSAQRGAHVPRLSRAQLSAMEVLDGLNNDPRFVLSMDLRPGDLQFLNNHVIMHGRSRYEDHAEPERRRDLIRLWLDAPGMPQSAAPAGGQPTRP